MTFQPAPSAPIDAELWWIVYLRGSLVGRLEPYAQNVWVDRRVPDQRRDRMVVVRKDGGNVDGVLDRPRIALDVWAKTEKDATDLANLMVALSLAAPLSDAGCVRVRHTAGPNAVPETSGQPRRLALIEATHRAIPITV